MRPQPAASNGSSIAAPNETGNAISALGRLEPEGGLIHVAAPTASITAGGSRVLRLLVKEGAAVKANQPLAVLDTYDSLLATAMQADAQVKEAEARLAQVQAGAKRGEIVARQATVQNFEAELTGEIKAQAARLDRLQAEFLTAQAEYKRYDDLYRNGGISASALDAKRLALRTAEEQLNEAKAVLERTQRTLQAKILEAQATVAQVAEVRPTDVQQAQAQVQVAAANFQRAKADLDKAIVRAPVDGQVIKIHADPGEVVGTQGVLDLGRTDQMYAVAEVDENFINRVKVGQRARITGYAFPGEMTGTVDQVGRQVRKNEVLNTDPVDRTDTRVVEVKIRLDNGKPVAGLSNLQVKVAIDQ
jgi:HlyD family secretion protein